MQSRYSSSRTTGRRGEIDQNQRLPRMLSTNSINKISGVYKSVCHPMERIILERQQFPRCAACNHDTNWTFVRKLAPKPRQAPPSEVTTSSDSSLRE
jgi:hypothetical protein